MKNSEKKKPTINLKKDYPKKFDNHAEKANKRFPVDKSTSKNILKRVLKIKTDS